MPIAECGMGPGYLCLMSFAHFTWAWLCMLIILTWSIGHRPLGHPRKSSLPMRNRQPWIMAGWHRHPVASSRRRNVWSIFLITNSLRPHTDEVVGQPPTTKGLHHRQRTDLPFTYMHSPAHQSGCTLSWAVNRGLRMCVQWTRYGSTIVCARR